MTEQDTECAVCGSAQFELSDGLFFCLDCGTQSQDVREEIIEEEADVRFIRTLKLSTRKTKPDKCVEVEPETPVERFQTVLLKQCQALIGLGFNPVFKESVKMLWFHYLKHYGYAFAEQEGLTELATPTSGDRLECSDTHTPVGMEKVIKMESEDTTPLTPSKAKRKKTRQKPAPVCMEKVIKLEAVEDNTALMPANEAGRTTETSAKTGEKEVHTPVKTKRSKVKSKTTSEAPASMECGGDGEGSTHTPAKTKQKDTKRKTTPTCMEKVIKTESDIEVENPTTKRKSPNKKRKTAEIENAEEGQTHTPTKSKQNMAAKTTSKTSDDTPRKSRGKRKLLSDEATPSKSNKRRKISLKQNTEDSSLFEDYPDDSNLFKSEGMEEDEGRWSEGGDGGDGAAVKLSASELYFSRRQNSVKNRRSPEYISLKNNLALLYLGLLYSKQDVLVSDLSRWTKTNVLPYHNISSVLPRSMCTGHTFASTFTATFLMSADRIYNVARHLYLHLPLPELPSPNAGFICHTLVDRLKLPGCFHSMVDKMLAVVYCPEFMYGFVGHNNMQRRFDADCMAIIVLLLRLIYKLDDKYEFDVQSADILVVDRGLEDTTTAVYVWEDWVQVCVNHLHDSMRAGIPLTKSEFSRVKDYQKYLDFCRVEIFTNTRHTPLKSLFQYNPKHYSSISELFKQSTEKLTKCREKASAEEGGKQWDEENPLNSQETHSNTETANTILNKVDTENIKRNHAGPFTTSSGSCSEQSLHDLPSKLFTPRLLPLETLVSDFADCTTSYEILPRSYKNEHMVGIDLSHSMQFLLNVCAELIDIEVEDLYHSLMIVETGILKNGVPVFQRIERQFAY